MTSHTTERFRQLFAALPLDAQRQAQAAYQLFKQNPRHNSLRFRRISPTDPSLYSARVGQHYRAIAKMVDDIVYWTWIGDRHTRRIQYRDPPPLEPLYRAEYVSVSHVRLEET